MNFTQTQIRGFKSALKDKTLVPYHKRIQVVYFRSQKMTYKTIPESIGFSHDTIWRLVKKYEHEDLSSLIQDTRGGCHCSYLIYEEEKSFLQ
ncbi:MAG: helix-turn-helix domain-containing protein [Streptococcus orisratti]|uniref:helix-turn-helix domain-containing protein n=1 Tax=Streptococcus orisratti TaxID=114652 RepID=UPI002A87FB3D|nr:helix-turn-helix domain-containing protein [Streptococcus orisratti]MDY4001373.1 helix-turn-helix domain-containing protein [Streptococcus orisratti]MDY5636314.1 helix-turn-helix domain-containing protein [Streptococcus orisratti]